MNFLLQLLISAALMVASYLIAPKPQQPKREFQKGEEPTSEAGRPIPVLFGTKTIADPNCLWWGNKYTDRVKVS